MTISFNSQGYILDAIDDPAWDKSYMEDPWAFVYHLALNQVGADDPGLAFIVKIADQVIGLIASQPDSEIQREKLSVAFDEDEADALVAGHPYAIGERCIDRAWIGNACNRLFDCYRKEIRQWKGTVESYFASFNPDLKVAQRIYFHLVENKDGIKPFAFMATYANAKSKHVPLAMALVEYKKDQGEMVKLLSPLSKAAGESVFINSLLDTGELFKPIMLSADEAYTFLKEIPIYQNAGICCRIPDFWKRNATKPKVSVSVGRMEKSLFGVNSLLDFEPFIVVDGVRLTKKDLQDMLNGAQGLRLIKGKWVEVDKQKLEELLRQYDSLEEDDSISISKMTRSLLGEKSGLGEDVEITNGAWLKDLMAKLRSPAKLERVPVSKNLHATLRPYQEDGFVWLSELCRLGLGSCLADDMGLGKTIQVLALIARLSEDHESRMLLVVPPSLTGNWEHEIQMFLPSVTPTLLLGSSKQAGAIDCGKASLYITTYSLLDKLKNVAETKWDLVVIDEAQAIKNSGTKQAKAVKTLQAKERIALTGTPVENSLGDLWSIFDWLNPGMLGSKGEFASFLKNQDEEASYSRIRQIVSPFILRRMKSDKTIIQDLPEKLEEKQYPLLTKLQGKLYENVLDDLKDKLENSDGIERKGLVLSSIMKFKQICNHPSQYEGSDYYKSDDSGKFLMLQSLCEAIKGYHERVLVFTQFREIIPALDDCLAQVFGERGLTLHGGTPVKDRTKLVATFNDVHYCPYMILSLKAGGTGLNLTSANHVIHFDRWWNPAVENQATDRAYRIGQKKNVVVHTFVTKGTIEEKIDQLLTDKRKMSDEILASSGEGWITKLSDKEILDICSLEEGHR